MFIVLTEDFNTKSHRRECQILFFFFMFQIFTDEFKYFQDWCGLFSIPVIILAIISPLEKEMTTVISGESREKAEACDVRAA